MSKAPSGESDIACCLTLQHKCIRTTILPRQAGLVKESRHPISVAHSFAECTHVIKTVQERLKRNQIMKCCRGLRMNTADEEN